MKKVYWLGFTLLGIADLAHSDVLKYKLSQTSVRPYVFVDDSAWEAAPKSRALPSQTRLLGGQPPSDPREYLLRDQVQGTTDGQQFKAIYQKSVEEVLSQQFLPAFSKLLRSDLGGTESP